MNMKTGLVIFLVSFGIGFGLCKYLEPEVTNTTKEDKKVEKNEHTTTTTTKKPNGEVVIIKTKDSNTKVDDKKDSTTVVVPKKIATVQALIAFRPGLDHEPHYGVSVSTHLIGPVVIGVFGIDNGTLGGSLGMEF